MSPEEPTRRIVVGVDGSPPSVAALQWAARQAEMTSSEVDVFMTWQWPLAFGLAVPFPPEYNPEADARNVLDRMVGEVRSAHPKVAIVTAVVEGHPAPTLVEESRGADLLVVGSRGHGEFTGMLLGSVSEHCVTNAHCPVVVVRERS